MTRGFIAAFCAGVVTSVGLSACLQPATCGGGARPGRYVIRQAVNFDEVPVSIVGGHLEVDFERDTARVVYPNETGFVELRILSGGGGAGGSN